MMRECECLVAAAIATFAHALHRRNRRSRVRAMVTSAQTVVQLAGERSRSSSVCWSAPVLADHGPLVPRSGRRSNLEIRGGSCGFEWLLGPAKDGTRQFRAVMLDPGGPIEPGEWRCAA